MDGRITKAQEKLDSALKATAAAAVELQQMLPEHQGVPHFSVIEQDAHEVGVRLSRLIQHRRSGDVAAEAGGQARCPECQKLCEVVSKTRTVQSIDGVVELIESQARCSRCERAFFPSADDAGV